MIGAAERSRVLPDPRATAGHAEPDPAPTLAPAPEGLSARRVERWLDLPPGAWQRRRLFALRIRAEAFSYLGMRAGDLVIVEPGAREQPGQVVVTRSARGPSLRKIPHSVPMERRLPTVLELPLKERGFASDERVVGTVIGLLRSTGTGALRPVPLGTALRPRPKSPRSRTIGETLAANRPARPVVPVVVDQLLETRRRWHDWLVRERTSPGLTATPAQLSRWERLDASLATLCDCLEHTHSAGLRAALAAEASAVVTAIRAEMGG